MLSSWRSFYLSLACLIFCFSAAKSVEAIPNPSAINWGAPPPVFVTSLYAGVLGRAPESAAVVTAHAASVTSSPTSRWNKFWVFVNSPEYKGSSWARKPRTYNVYRRDNGIRRNYTYTVSKGPMNANWRHMYGKTTFGIASALRGFYYEHYPRP